MGFIQRLQRMQNLWENIKVGKVSLKKRILNSKIEALDLYKEGDRQRGFLEILPIND